MSEPFARVPLWILGRSDVSWAGKILYGIIAKYIGKGATAWPSIAQLAADMRTSDRNVRLWLSELRDGGLVDIERTGRASTYRLLGSQPEEPPEGAVLMMPDRQTSADQSGSVLPVDDRQTSAALNGSVLPISPAEVCRSGVRIPFSMEEIIEKTTEEGPPSTGGGPLAEAEFLISSASAALLRGYQARYERMTRDAWMGASKATADIRVCARWVIVEGAAQIDARADRILDGAFADEWMVEHRWPWAAIAKDPARFASPRPQRKGRSAAVFLQAKPDQYAGGDLGDADIPADAPAKVIGYG